MVKYNLVVYCLMTEYNFQYEECGKCHQNNYCIELPIQNNSGWLCQDCFCWSVGFADEKDKMKLLFKEIPDIEN